MLLFVAAARRGKLRWCEQKWLEGEAFPRNYRGISLQGAGASSDMISSPLPHGLREPWGPVSLPHPKSKDSNLNSPKRPGSDAAHRHWREQKVPPPPRADQQNLLQLQGSLKTLEFPQDKKDPPKSSYAKRTVSFILYQGG